MGVESSGERSGELRTKMWLQMRVPSQTTLPSVLARLVSM
jgi:hypothetical protein